MINVLLLRQSKDSTNSVSQVAMERRNVFASSAFLKDPIKISLQTFGSNVTVKFWVRYD